MLLLFGMFLVKVIFQFLFNWPVITESTPGPVFRTAEAGVVSQAGCFLSSNQHCYMDGRHILSCIQFFVNFRMKRFL